MRSMFPLLFVVALPSLAQSTITTIAGNGSAAFSGDGGTAISAALNRPVYVHVDPAGNLYVADETNNRIRKIDTSGTITTVAGNGNKSFSGDGGPAIAASLNAPTGVCSDSSGNIYINDTLNHRIRRVDRSGVITTYAGNGSNSSSADGPATTTALNLPIRCDVDAAGNLFLAEQGGHRIRRVSPSGAITTIAGTGASGFSGDSGPATAATLNNPTSVVVDYSGNVYFSDQFNQRIRKVTPTGVISTIAGTGSAGFSGDNGPATSASINFPGGLAIDQTGNLYFADSPNQRIRRISSGGIITTIAGNGSTGFAGDGGPSLAAAFNGPFGIALDNFGNLYIADTTNNRVRRITAATPATAPQFTSAAVVNSASFKSGITPGGLVTIFGTNLSPANGIVLNNVAPWPTQLAGVSVTVAGTPARLYSLVGLGGTEQISFQAPFEVAGSSSANVVITNNGSTSASVSVPVLSAQPGIFLIDATRGAFLKPNFSVITTANTVRPGEAVVMFLTGLGAVNPSVATGAIAPSAEPFARTAATPTVRVGSQQAQLLYSGLAPGYIGLYQVNFVVPESAPTGSVDVVVSAGGTDGNIAKLEIR